MAGSTARSKRGPAKKQPKRKPADKRTGAAGAKRASSTRVDVADLTIDPAAWELVPQQLIARHRVVPIGVEDGKLRLVVADARNVIALDDVRTITGLELDVMEADPADIDDLVRRVAKLDRSAQELFEQAVGDTEDEDEEVTADDAPIVKALNRIIAQAVSQRASDVHIEPRERDVRIRYRIDGVLSEAMTTKRSLLGGITSRLKVMSDLDIAERRVPQDGRATVRVQGRAVDLRVATLPTSWGEKVVLRVLDRGAEVMKLTDLGFGDHAMARYAEAFRRPHGAVLVTGPTGSGKSTTLYATLEEINDAARNIITVEDPVEARIEGVNQMQVNRKAGLTFAGALRSMLRADPDVMMVGEMRDTETAMLGVEAALTGHLVLATLHTNDAPSALTRLIEMGVEPFLVSSAIECVVAQRLARKLCVKCSEPTEALDNERDALGEVGAGTTLIRRPVGCTYCSKTGYRGRIALVEVMPMNDELRAFTVDRYPAEEIKKAALTAGMRTLREDGLAKALQGITSVEEVLRVVA